MANLHQLVSVIIQNSHSFLKEKRKEKGKKRGFMFLFSFCFFIATFYLNAQDSIVPQESVSEKTNLKFQEYFFTALTEKSIENYKKAIENLDECNQLIPNNKAVLFELSKNYYALNKLPEAIEYANTALQQDADNLWILEHFVKVYKKNRNFKDAIKIQQKIAVKHPKKKQSLVFLHLQNNDKTSAITVLQELAEAKMLNSRLREIKRSLERKKHPKKKTQKVVTLNNKNQDDLKNLFEKEKSYASLQKLLRDLAIKNDADLLTYSEKGLALFPAQPFVYLMNGRAHNNKNQFKKAVNTLQNGIDFVIDNKKLSSKFYKELIKAYKGLGDTINVNKYQRKLKS